MSDRVFRAFEVLQNDYLRESEFADVEARRSHVRWLREEQRRIAGELWDEANQECLPDGLPGADAVEAALMAHSRAEEVVIEREIIGRLPRRLVHERRNAWAYLESEFTAPLDPDKVDTGPASTQHWIRHGDEAHGDVERIGGPLNYTGLDPIEDVALPPRVNWSAADHRAMLEKAIEIYGLEPGQWMELEWPPTASLLTPGSVYTTEFEPCAVHAEFEAGMADCEDCAASVREVVDQVAQWNWSAKLTVKRIDFDGAGMERQAEVYEDPAFEVAVIEQDPRDLVIGPRWGREAI